MKVIYFTDGALIDDLNIRKSLLRIPEIIQCLRVNQKEFLNCDLFIVMMDQGVYDGLNYHQKLHLKTFLQEALYQRWQKKGIEPDLIIRRKDYSDFSQLASTFVKLSTVDSLKIVTIGPGFDELETFLRVQLKVQSFPQTDMISQDPKLDWFWDDVKSQLQLHS